MKHTQFGSEEEAPVTQRIALSADHRNDMILIRVQSPRIDAAVSTDFKQRLKSFIQDGDIRLEVDLTAVELIDSSGLGALVSALKVLPEQGWLRLSGLNGFNRRIFHLTKLDRVFEIV